jgi:transposase-like protein
MRTTVYKDTKRINGRAKQVIQEMERGVIVKESRIAMIQALIPLGLKAIEAELQDEVTQLVGGDHYERTGGKLKRWGYNPGSAFIGDQKVKINVPRVRNASRNQEVPLKSYERLQDPTAVDEMALSRVINGISQGKYEKAAEHVPETFGISKSAVSRKFIRASGRKLEEFMNRDLSGYDIVAIFMDGKCFAENEMVIALGITIDGDKVLLGLVETSTENHKVCRDFLNELKRRGLNLDEEILFIIDGGKGLYKGIVEVMGERAVIGRCQWHKRENVVDYLSKERRDGFRAKLQAAYEEPSYELAKRALMTIRAELKLINESAVNSLDEGFEETLVLHRLGLFDKLGKSFKTTNCIENVNKQLELYTGRVSRWHNSNQRRRWVATALLEVEPRLNRVMGHEHLKELRAAMKRLVARRKKENAA